MQDFDDPDEVALPSAPAQSSSLPYKTVPVEAVKGWTILYPIYIDSKRPHTKGARRVPSSHAVEWPLADQMARACVMLGFQGVYEPNHSHPKDWQNPGRVRVLMHHPGTRDPVHRSIKTKLALLKRIGAALQAYQSKPDEQVPIERRLPAHSPAVSLGILDQAAVGKGPFANMFPGLAGGGPDDEAQDARQQQAQQQPKMIKPKKVHIRRR